MPIINEPAMPVNLDPQGLDWALEHSLEYGDTVFFPKAFEYHAIKHDWVNVKAWLLGQDMRKWTPRPLRRFMATKSHFSFRYVTQLDPLEYLAFTALIWEIGQELESSRIPPADEVAFSWRFSPAADGQMYDPQYEWTPFNQKCLEHARDGACNWVVIADIADFFPHIYIHPVEQALARATNHLAQAYCVMRFIRNWNAFVSYGLPVGVSASRIIAEATIVDIDQTIAGFGSPFCRYADDIRIFCSTEEDAYSALEELAAALFENHGLTLQPAKTSILAANEYLSRFAIAPERVEAESLTARFHELLEAANVQDRYDADFDYDDLPQDVQEDIDKLNLAAVLEEQVGSDHPDPVVMRILLHRMGQLDMDDPVDELLDNIEALGHVIDSVVRYFRHLRAINATRRAEIGAQVLDACGRASTSGYQRACLLSLFADDKQFDNEDDFEEMFRHARDNPTKRKLILALGRAGKEHIFIRLRRDYASLEPWTRRAFLAAFSCVPLGARAPFYRSLRGGSDVLEQAVVAWASANPFA